MPITKEPFYFSKNKQDPIIICGINFEKPDQNYLAKKVFWTRADCLDFLLNLQHSYRAIEKVKIFRDEFIDHNSDVGKLQTKKKQYQFKSPLTQNYRPVWFQGSNQSIVSSEKLNTINKEFDLQTHKEQAKGIALFNEKYPDVSAIIDYAIECMQFIHDLFNSQNFSTVNTNNGLPIKCNPKQFIIKSKEAGFRCMWALNQKSIAIENNSQIPNINEFIYSITPEIEIWWQAFVKQAKINCFERVGVKKRLLDISKERLYEASVEVYKKQFADIFDYLKLYHIDNIDLYILTDQEKRDVVRSILKKAIQLEKIREKNSLSLTEWYGLYQEAKKNKSQ